MKKPSNAKKNLAKKPEKGKDSGELRKPTKLIPLKEKDKKNWKNNLDDDDDDFTIDDEDVKFNSGFEDDDDESDTEFYEDGF